MSNDFAVRRGPGRPPKARAGKQFDSVDAALEWRRENPDSYPLSADDFVSAELWYRYRAAICRAEAEKADTRAELARANPEASASEIEALAKALDALPPDMRAAALAARAKQAQAKPSK
jgi:imidazolonepropionase-like amidohydrolase